MVVTVLADALPPQGRLHGAEAAIGKRGVGFNLQPPVPPPAYAVAKQSTRARRRKGGMERLQLAPVHHVRTRVDEAEMAGLRPSLK